MKKRILWAAIIVLALLAAARYWAGWELFAVYVDRHLSRRP